MFADGSSEEEWRDPAGLYHRTDGPALTEYDRNGNIEAEGFYAHGDLHRRGGPAVARYRPDGSVYAERWAVKGKTSRIDGPAEAHRDEQGVIATSCHYFRGRSYSGLPEIAKDLSALDEEELTEELSYTELAPLLDEGYPASLLPAVLAAGITTAEGGRALLDGAPAEWVRSFEEGRK